MHRDEQIGDLNYDCMQGILAEKDSQIASLKELVREASSFADAAYECTSSEKRHDFILNWLKRAKEALE